ncbi:ATPase [Dyella monticola]|uniref:ATPase n=1 Tax=Dyella monticola TaxID=1927958 RepID=A0A370WRL6_9GAMM|nr:SRPBCC family protein [Dyella monticola]RDS78741.1 ATPase [Dyella monticola]
MAKSTCVYVSYIRTTPEKLWSALTDGEFMKQYWFGAHGESRWTAGSPWKLLSGDGKVLTSGEIVEATPLKRLIIRWTHENSPALKDDVPSLLTMELEPFPSAVKLTLTHSIEREPSKLIEEVSKGWPLVISNLKSFLETGSIALEDPYPQSCA